MKIITIVKDFIDIVKLKSELASFNYFLLTLQGSFLELKIITFPNQKIKSIRERLDGHKEYSEYGIRYDNLVNRISDHNFKISQIDKEVTYFSFGRTVAKIDLLDNGTLDNLVQAMLEILRFKKYDKKYQIFVNEVKELNDNRQIILEQFNTAKECTKFYKDVFTYDYYIDEKMKIKLKTALEIAQNKIRQYPKQYFEILEFRNLERDVLSHNNNYIERHINDKLFENVNGWSLGLDQRKAILTDSVSNLVIAGAGSGKTLTICGKAKWLLEDKKISKEDIVFLSYSKASADDLERKLSGVSDNLNVSTFHSLGLSILENKDDKKQNVEANYDAIIERFFSSEMLESQNIDILRKVLEFYGKFAFTLDEEKYETKGEQFEKLKEADFQTLKQILINLSNNQEERETILKEKVKSFEELAIANFYFLNGIKYRYEKPFPDDTTNPDYRQYNPDFTLIEHNIFHEHFGVDRNGQCSQYTKDEAALYIQSMKWKEQLHLQKNTKFIKSYSYEFKEETIFDNLEKNLKIYDVELKPISSEEVREALGSIYKNRNFKSFIKLVKSFINLYKSRYPDNTYFEELKNEKFANAYERQRSILFLDICKEIFDFYKCELGEKIDFDDMILEAIEHIPNTNKFKYKYIVVDEFQDISYSRMEFIRALIKHGDAKLFAVGDDWQSIYRFAGSDLGIFIHFDNYFEMSTECHLISNFRNSEELHAIVEPFITANPEQKKKDIECSNKLSNPVNIIFYESTKASALNAALKEIEKINPFAKVLLLGRNNFDIEDFLSKTIEIKRDGTIIHHDFQGMDISFKTIHKSKGLEEEFVVVLNNEDSKTGLPNKIEDDPILSLVLSDKSRFQYSEERRLFYVALTRTKTFCYLLVDSKKPSIFIKEIEARCNTLNPELIDDKDVENCPHCKTGRLVLRGEWGNQFYGCSNYPYCEYNQKKAVVESSRRCPNCNHFIVWRDGKWGKFLGCSNYPRCKITIANTNPHFEKWKPIFNRNKKDSI
ncbi:MAG: UvrD-helicase domain-containing protein [Bacilli bacterium]